MRACPGSGAQPHNAAQHRWRAVPEVPPVSQSPFAVPKHDSAVAVWPRRRSGHNIEPGKSEFDRAPGHDRSGAVREQWVRVRSPPQEVVSLSPFVCSGEKKQCLEKRGNVVISLQSSQKKGESETLWEQIGKLESGHHFTVHTLPLCLLTLFFSIYKGGKSVRSAVD
jgi:hypothetical protein